MATQIVIERGTSSEDTMSTGESCGAGKSSASPTPFSTVGSVDCPSEGACVTTAPSGQRVGSPTGTTIRCAKHDFGHDQEEVGAGSYGTVYKVNCRTCGNNAARKDVRISKRGDVKSREKKVKAMKDELTILASLDHPNIVQYIAHEDMPNGTLSIYTEFCELLDLERYINLRWDGKSATADPLHETLFCEEGAWSILRQLGSAMAKCHHGLNAAISPDGSDEYCSIETQWRPIVHRDIKPGNMLLKFVPNPNPSNLKSESTHDPASRPTDAICVKLCDFGMAYMVQEGIVRSTDGGTKEFWAPEVWEQAIKGDYRVTAWSVKSDIWSIGVIMHNFLVGDFPVNKGQIPSPDETAQKMTRRLTKLNGPLYEAPDVLIKLICECLDPVPTKRATVLNILAVALKADVTDAGMKRSESFWRTLASTPRDENGPAAQTVRHFTSDYLRLIDDSPFSATEACYILSLQAMYMKNALPSTASYFSQIFSGTLDGGSVFHAVATATSENTELRKLVWEETQWPRQPELSRMSIRRDNKKNLPSTVAILCSNLQVFRDLNEIEEKSKAEEMSQAIEHATMTVRKQMKQEVEREISFLVAFLSNGRQGKVSWKRNVAERALVNAASHGYNATVHKLAEWGVDVCASSGRRSETALHFAASSGNEELVSFLVEHNASVECRDYHGTVPLHCAAWSGHYATVRFLLSHDANVNAQDNEGRTALYGAAKGGHLTVVRALLACGADKNILGGTKKQTALQNAVAMGHLEVVRELGDARSTALQDKQQDEVVQV